MCYDDVLRRLFTCICRWFRHMAIHGRRAGLFLPVHVRVCVCVRLTQIRMTCLEYTLMTSLWDRLWRLVDVAIYWCDILSPRWLRRRRWSFVRIENSVNREFLTFWRRLTSRVRCDARDVGPSQWRRTSWRRQCRERSVAAGQKRWVDC